MIKALYIHYRPTFGIEWWRESLEQIEIWTKNDGHKRLIILKYVRD